MKKSRQKTNFFLFGSFKDQVSSGLGICISSIFDRTETTLVGGLVGTTCYSYSSEDDYDIYLLYIIKNTNIPWMIQENNPREPRVNKQIIFIVCVYVILTASNRFSANNNQSDGALIKKIQNQNTNISLSTILGQIDKQKFQGDWNQVQKGENSLFPRESGKFQMYLSRHSENQSQKFSIDIHMKNGEYIDDGQISFRISELEVSKWRMEHVPNKLTARMDLNETNVTVSYIQQIIFKTMSRGQFNITNLQIIFQVEANKTDLTLAKRIKFQSLQDQVVLGLKNQKFNMSGTILFALILFLVAYSQFRACLQIMKNFIDNQQDPINFSFATLTMAIMWDAALCLTSFIEAFQNEENIILFIIPAFILCILFTNLELRIMIMVFQAISGQNDIRQIICRFNFVSYGAIIGMYPLLVFTNMGSSLFIIFSLIFLPQLYTNAVRGKRPNLNSIFYNEFLLYRFLIVLYLKCFPYNIFNLKPNYFLGFGCLLIVGCQFALLWVQKIYGPKKILPKFLLPPVYSYECELTVQQLSSTQCTICLQGLNKHPECQPQQIEVMRIMKTPCGHRYHGVCLSQWMKLKMECPQCRAKLPAYQ